MTTTPALSATPTAPRTRPDFGLVAVVALCLLALWPLLRQPGLPNGEDILYHVYRAAEMDRAWAQGTLWPRWAESFYLGYGSPLFHYYAGGTYVVTSLLMRLGLDALNSARALIALCMIGGGVGMYLWLRGHAGRLAGVIAAVCYVYSPYFVSTEPYGRGVLPELLALALFPFVLWRYDRLLRGGGGRALALAALSSAALILLHNLMAVVCTAIVAAWVVWNLTAAALRRSPPLHMERGPGGEVSRGAIYALLALALGVALTAFFWLPVLAERDAVRLENLTAVAQLDYRGFFVPLPELLAFSPRVDAGALNGLENRYNLGVAQWLLALGGLAAALRWPGAGQRPFALFLALMALALIVLMLPQAGALWAALPPLAYLQFPWRLLGPVGALLAALAGLNAQWIERLPARAGALAAALIVALPIALALPTLYIDEWDYPTLDTSVAAYHAAELDGRQRATTFSNEYLPRAVITEPGPTPRLLADFADGWPVDHAHREVFPPGVAAALLAGSPQQQRWRVTAAEPFAFEALIYAFPGWTAAVDGQPVPVRASDPHGLIVFDIPAGTHEVTLSLGATPPRTLGAVISLLAAGVVVALLVVRHRPRPAPPIPPLTAPLRLGVAAGWGLALALLLLLMRPGVMWEQSPPGEARLAQQQVDYRLGDSLRLIGYDLSATVFRPGDTLALTLYWYASAPLDYGYASFVHIGQGGPPLAQADKLNPAGLPTRTWTADGFIQDSYRITLPPDMPPGAYALTVGLYTCDTRPPGECGSGDRLPVTDAAGAPLGDAVPLTVIEVR